MLFKVMFNLQGISLVDYIRGLANMRGFLNAYLALVSIGPLGNLSDCVDTLDNLMGAITDHFQKDSPANYDVSSSIFWIQVCSQYVALIQGMNINSEVSFTNQDLDAVRAVVGAFTDALEEHVHGLELKLDSLTIE